MTSLLVGEQKLFRKQEVAYFRYNVTSGRKRNYFGDRKWRTITTTLFPVEKR